MRVLVAIAHYGTKNRSFLERVLDEYASMSLNVDVVILTEAAKTFAHDVEVIVGLPIADPWSLPFGHRQLFAERRDSYDLFIYSEDDILVTEENVLAYVEQAAKLPADRLAGFVRFEIGADGKRFFPDSHSGYHWRPSSIEHVGGEVYASYSNEHAACYILTREQLDGCIASDGYLVAPHAGRYDMLVSAATDPYVTCGKRKVIPLERIEEFLVHHLPNNYIGRLGSFEEEFEAELAAITRAVESTRLEELFAPEKALDTEMWDKSFHESLPPRLRHVDWREGSTVLSVGVGDGEAERGFVERGVTVYGIPMNTIVGELAAEKGIIILPANLDEALAHLEDVRLDAAMMVDVLPHLRDPVRALSSVRAILRPGGQVFATSRNALFERLGSRLGRRSSPPGRNDFSQTLIWPADGRRLRHWFSEAQLRPQLTCYWSSGRDTRLPSMMERHLDAVISDRVMVQAVNP